MKIQSGTLATGILLAGITAGPILVTITTLLAFVTYPGTLVSFDARGFMTFLLIFLPVSVIGAIIGLPVSAIGAGLMMKLGEWTDLAHPRLAWTIAGGLIGLVAGLLMGWAEAPPALIGLILTCAISARICRKDVVWVDEDGEEA